MDCYYQSLVFGFWSRDEKPSGMDSGYKKVDSGVVRLLILGAIMSASNRSGVFIRIDEHLNAYFDSCFNHPNFIDQKLWIVDRDVKLLIERSGAALIDVFLDIHKSFISSGDVFSTKGGVVISADRLDASDGSDVVFNVSSRYLH